MSDVFYALYNLNDLSVVSVGGASFGDIPDGFDVCTVDQQDGEELVTGVRALHDYFVKVVNGHAIFKYKNSDLISRRGVLSNNIVRDLHYRIVFFDNLNITYTCKNNVIVLNFDITKINDLFEDKFKAVVTSENSDCILYITEFQYPTALIDKRRFSLKELATKNQLSITVTADTHISVFASRT